MEFLEMPEEERFKGEVLSDLTPFHSANGMHFDKIVAYAFGTKL
jgi:hypothetical protein